CVLGQTLVEELFGDESPLGKEVFVNDVPLRVLGVLTRKGTNIIGVDEDDILLAPWTTIKFRVSGSSTPHRADPPAHPHHPYPPRSRRPRWPTRRRPRGSRPAIRFSPAPSRPKRSPPPWRRSPSCCASDTRSASSRKTTSTSATSPKSSAQCSRRWPWSRV